MSPTSAGGFVRRAAPEPNKRALYVGGLDPRVTEDVLRQIFETTGHVQNVKIIPDKNVGAVSIKSISLNCSSFASELKLLIFISATFSSFSTLAFHILDASCSLLHILLGFTFQLHDLLSTLICVRIQSKGFNYGFIEYDDPGAAERAMQTLNGRRVHQAVRALHLA